MAEVTVTTEQVHELIQQLAAMTAAASITPEIVANIFERMRNLNDQERLKVIAVAEAYIEEIQEQGVSAEKVEYQNDVLRNVLDNNQITGYDLSPVGFISGSNVWQYNKDYELAIIPVKEGDIVKISPSTSRFIAYLTTNSHVVGDTPDYVSGTSRSSSSVQNLTMPAGCKYFAFAVKSSGTDIIPTNIYVNGRDRLPSIINRLNKLSETSVRCISLIHGAIVPNIDSVNKTLTFKTDNHLLIDWKRFVMPTTPISFEVSGTSASKLILNIITGVFSAISWNAVIGEDDVIIGAFRYTNDNVYATLPFEYTIDNIPIYLKQTDFVHKEHYDSISDITLVQGGDTRVYAVYDASIGLKISLSVDGIKFAINERKGSTTLKDSGWKTSVSEYITSTDCDSVRILFAQTDGTSEIVPNDVISAVQSIDIEHYTTSKVPNYELFGELYNKAYTQQGQLDTKSSVTRAKIEKGKSFNDVIAPSLYVSGGKRIVCSKVPTTPDQVFNMKLVNNSSYQFALLFANSSNVDIYDSGWKTSIKNVVAPEGAVSFFIRARLSDNSDLTDSDVTAFIADVEEFDYTVRNEYKIGSCVDYEDFLATKKEIASLQEQSVPLRGIDSIAHQGYSATQSTGRSKVESYVAAAEAGFNWGETDIAYSSDEVAMCSHDQTFVDGISGDTIVIAEHTAAELKTYEYFGGEIATFEEVLRTCKENGLGLYIDHLENVNTSARLSDLLDIIKKYQMGDKVVWLNGQSKIEDITAVFPRSSFGLTLGSYPEDWRIQSLNNLKTSYPQCTFFLNILYTVVTVADIIRWNAMCNDGVSVQIWTCDDYTYYGNFLPYVTGITSNTISEPILKKHN